MCYNTVWHSKLYLVWLEIIYINYRQTVLEHSVMCDVALPSIYITKKLPYNTLWCRKLYLVELNDIHVLYHCLIKQCIAWSLTLFGLQANKVKFMNMAQHKWVGADHVAIRLDSKLTVIWLTANHMNVCFIAICSCIENHVIAPCAISLHVAKIISPWSISINEGKQLCSISL